MSLFQNLSPIVSELRVAIRHIIGISLRKASDYLLRDYNTVQPPEPDLKAEPEIEDSVPAPKPRDRSKYKPMENGAVPSALYGALTVMLTRTPHSAMTVSEILEEIEATDSTLRKGFKILVEEKVLESIPGSPLRFAILDLAKAEWYIREFDGNGVPLFLKKRETPSE
jgi:hypothetical protein